MPEIPFSFDSVIKKVFERDRGGSLFTNIVVAEGAMEHGKSELYLDKGEMRLGGIGEIKEFIFVDGKTGCCCG